MQGNQSQFSRKQETAVAALLTSRTIEEAAKSVGVSLSTLTRWLQEPEFQSAYRKARRDVYGQAIARMQQSSSAAVATLLRVMVDPSTPASSKIRAADVVLANAAKAIELEDIEVRVAELERAAEAAEAKHHR